MAIHITLDNRHRITSDSHQYILVKDDRHWKFFIRLENLLKFYLSLKIRESNSSKVENLIQRLNEAEKRCEQAIAQLKLEGVKHE